MTEMHRVSTKIAAMMEKLKRDRSDNQARFAGQLLKQNDPDSSMAPLPPPASLPALPPEAQVVDDSELQQTLDTKFLLGGVGLA